MLGAASEAWAGGSGFDLHLTGGKAVDVKTKAKFAAVHMDCHRRVARYVCSGWSDGGPYKRQVLGWMLERNASNLDYHNHFARIELCETLANEVSRALGEGTQAWFLSASPKEYGVLAIPTKFPWRGFKRWIRRLLHGLNYIGAIEAAWYSNYQLARPRVRISFHFHVIVWGAEEGRVRAIKNHIVATMGRFIASQKVSRYKRIKPGTLLRVLRYLMKAPIQDYRLIGRTGEQVHFSEDKPPGRTKKDLLSPGNVIRMMLRIGDVKLADCMLAGGEGEPILARALALARDSLVQKEQARRQHLRAEVGGQV